MATISTSPDLASASNGSRELLVSLSPSANGTSDEMIAKLSQAFAGTSVIIAAPDMTAQGSGATSLKVVSYTPSVPSTASFTLTAADFLNAHEVAISHRAEAVLLLGPEAESLTPEALRGLADGVLGNHFDLSVPRYSLPARSGLVNSAILYPITRALFGATPRFPLSVDLCVSARMSERLATMAQKSTAANQPEGLVWAVAEATVANFAVGQIDVGTRVLPQPAASDLNTLLALVAGSLFADIDAKAAFWQRSRVALPVLGLSGPPPGSDVSVEEVQPMIEAFRMAYGNLSEIWSLVLPPQSLLGLKRLSVMTLENFSMPDLLWARVVYDFLLAFRLRTINRGHLLGALTPLYLAWVASHILQTSKGKDPESLIEAQAAAFETNKPYLVSRWRWPDRFNP